MFYKETIQNSENILNKFKTNRYVIFYSQMQSGKTSSFLHVACKSIELGLFQNVIILCGSNDITLKTQLITNKKDFIKDYCEEYSKCDEYTKNINIYFSQDLNHSINIKNNTLIIHDESHYDQSKQNIPFKNFYKNNNLSEFLRGDYSKIKYENIKLLSVSATPFSEMIENKYNKDSKKEIVKGVVSEKYRGVGYFSEHGMIKYESKPINNDNRAYLISILKLNETTEKGYFIIRTTNIKDYTELLKSISKEIGYKYICIDGDNTNSFDILNDKPTDNSLIHLCNKGRMGYAFENKKYIRMGYESSQKIKLDTGLQGLLGRFCGYKPISANIYINKSIKNEIEKYINGNYDNIKKATNLKKNKIKNGNGYVKDEDGQLWVSEVPISIPISIDVPIPYTNDVFKKIKKMIKNKEYDEKECSYRNIFQNTYRAINLEEKIIKAIKNNEKFTHNFSNGITNRKTINVKSQILMWGGVNLYLLRFTKDHGLVDNYQPVKVHPRCNYCPFIPLDTELIKTNGQIVGQPILYDFLDIEELKLNIKVSVKQTTKEHKNYIKGAQCILKPVQKGVTTDYIHMNLKTIAEVRDYLKKIENELSNEDNIKIKFNEIKKCKTDEKGKIKISGISWKHIII